MEQRHPGPLLARCTEMQKAHGDLPPSSHSAHNFPRASHLIRVNAHIFNGAHQSLCSLTPRQLSDLTPRCSPLTPSSPVTQYPCCSEPPRQTPTVGTSQLALFPVPGTCLPHTSLARFSPHSHLGWIRCSLREAFDCPGYIVCRLSA